MSTNFLSKEQAEKSAKWLVVDATGISVGRVASQVAALIRGKHKPSYTMHVSGGDHVIVINASKAVFTGNKLRDEKYYHYTGYIGGIKEIPASVQLEKHPDRVIKIAVKGMLPRGALGHQMIKRLRVFGGAEHTFSAQKPVEYKLRYGARSEGK